MAKPDIIKIEARSRTEFGKGAARRTRIAGDIPVVIYGAGLDVPKHILIGILDFHTIIRNHGANAILSVNIEDESQLSMVKIADQNPLTLDIGHADLLAIHRDEKVEVEIPVVPTGELAPGALLMQDAETILVSTPVLTIPREIEVSVGGAEVGTMVHTGDVTLSENPVLTDDADLLIFDVAEPEEGPAGNVDADIESISEAGTPDEPAEEETE